LIFHDRIAKAMNRASGMLGLVKKPFTCLDEITVPK